MNNILNGFFLYLHMVNILCCHVISTLWCAFYFGQVLNRLFLFIIIII